ncbi:MAG: carbamoyltransferase C-terminal domain-containing protein [Myxococcota bacterium]|nr:carbamoyltransferase C-terminal domain-containing protein [Myxococcota bacterium]
MGRFYIGLATTVHDPALAIVDEAGEVLFAEATERRLQYKRALHCIPDEPMGIGRVIDAHCGQNPELVVAHSWLERRWKSPLFRAGFKIVDRRISPLLAPTIIGQMNSFDLAGRNLAHRLHERETGGHILEHRYYDHHLSHAAAACFSSAFQEAACAVIDANGEHSSESFFHYIDGAIRPLGRRRLKSFSRNGSLGVFYAGLCVACGFDPLRGEEWKVMGLAPYGKRDDQLYAKMEKLLRVDDIRLVGNNWQMLQELASMRRPTGVDALECADLAHTGQCFFGDLMEELLKNLHNRCPSPRLVLSGGCALNSAFTGQIKERTPFDQIYVFPAPADDGNAVGAALLAQRQDHPAAAVRDDVLSPYLGSTLRADALERVETLGGLSPVPCTAEDLPAQVAARLADGKILGVARGRAEFGPRALGNRSILADPRDADVKDRLNAGVKFREEFRPFAPAILHEEGPSWFQDYQESPYMERALRFRPEIRERVPGVVHVDGTGRLQSVKKEWNPWFHSLLLEFHERSGVPILLNTSFNVMGKPIVHSVEDALSVFFTSGIDALVLEDKLYDKRAP